MKAYKAQHKIGTPYNFMRSLVTDDLKVVLAGNDLTGGVKPGGELESQRTLSAKKHLPFFSSYDYPTADSSLSPWHGSE